MCDPVVLTLTLICGLVAGAALTYLLLRQRLRLERELGRAEVSSDLKALEEKVASAQNLLNEQKRESSEREALLEEARKTLHESFETLSAKALKEQRKDFMELASESLDKRQAVFHEMLKPLKQSIEKVDHQYVTLQKNLSSNKSALEEQLKTLTLSNRELKSETDNLVKALRNPQARGRWGELTLKRVAELAGMVEHCDFSEQVSVKDGDSTLRPDMVVHPPGGQIIVVDAKAPLSAFLEALEAKSEDEKQSRLEAYGRHVKKHVQDLSRKAYWNQFDTSPEFVVMFVPGEHFYSAAVSQDPDLVETALASGVILATPGTLVSLLKSVAAGWRQQALADNAKEIQKLGKELYSRMAVLSKKLGTLHTHIGRTVNAYNETVASFESRLVPSAKRFTELGVDEVAQLEDAQMVDISPRNVHLLTTQESGDDTSEEDKPKGLSA